MRERPPGWVVFARIAFVAMAVTTLVFISFADNGVPNALLAWLRHIRHGDKYVHFLLYGLLAFLLHLGLRGRAWRLGPLALPLAALVVLAFGLGEEVAQLFSPRRRFEWVDLACNLGGVTVFTLLAHALLRVLQPSSDSQRA